MVYPVQYILDYLFSQEVLSRLIRTITPEGLNFRIADDPETVRCWLELKCLHHVPDVIRSLLKHAKPN